ncbi:hypothetical protein ILFOPFJJ_00872 [Ensifer psoraleae]|nr:hypothetical protein [Sinorhizobium psoraleae]
MRPFTESQGHDFPRLIDELVPSGAAMGPWVLINEGWLSTFGCCVENFCSRCLCPIRLKHNKRPMVLFGVRSVLVRHQYGLFHFSSRWPMQCIKRVPVRSLHLMDTEDFVCERTSRFRFLESIAARRGTEFVVEPRRHRSCLKADFRKMTFPSLQPLRDHEGCVSALPPTPPADPGP